MGFGEATGLIVQDSSKPAQLMRQLNRVPVLPIALYGLAVPGLGGLRPTSILAKQSELAPELSSDTPIACRFPEPSCLLVMTLGLIPLALFMKDTAELIPSDCL